MSTRTTTVYNLYNHARTRLLLSELEQRSVTFYERTWADSLRVQYAAVTELLSSSVVVHYVSVWYLIIDQRLVYC